MRRIRMMRLAATASAMLTVAGGILAFTEISASAAGSLSVSLASSGASSVVWSGAGNPVLNVGSSGFALMRVNNPSSAAPSAEPTFATDSFKGRSPVWSIEFAGGDELDGLPAKAGLGAANWFVGDPGSGPCHIPPPHEPDTYAAQLSFIQSVHCGGSVTAAVIIAGPSLGQAIGTSDTITMVQYAGMTLVPGPDVVTVTSPGSQASTLGVAIAPVSIQASSSKGDIVAPFAATGLPAGLSIDQNRGIISGTPTAAGTFRVTVAATDRGGTKGSVSFTWTVSTAPPPPPHVTFTGAMRLFKLGLCLDDAANRSGNGASVQVWRCNGLPNQSWQVVSDGTIRHNGLCLDARDFGVANGTPIQLWHCTGGPNQRWDTRGFRIHYDNPQAFRKVLDDPAFGRSGTRQELFSDNGGANQLWATF